MFRKIIKYVPKLENKMSPMISTIKENKSILECGQKKNLHKYCTLSTSIPSSTLTGPKSKTIETQKREKDEFVAVFQELSRDISERVSKLHGKEIADWIYKILQYNVLGGKMSRGLFTVDTYKILVGPSEQTQENLRLCRILACCIEMLQAALIIWDDIMDKSLTRRNQPCWYTLDDVGLNSIRDAHMIKNEIGLVFGKYCRNKDYYERILELYYEICFISGIGESFDLNISRNVKDFNMEMYRKLAINKTGFYTIYMPVACAMNLAMYKSSEIFLEVKPILLEIGHMFQAQDDFLDCFGDPKIIGKIGTDIEENKCTWLAAKAMEQSNDSQKAIMRECYGSSDPEKVNKVKKLYADLEIKKMFAEFEAESFRELETQIRQISGIPQEVFYNILNKLFKRKT